MKKVIFMSFSLGDNAISDYFMALIEKLKNDYQIVVFSDIKQHNKINIPNDIIVKYWPSKRPVKIADAIFLYKIIKKYKPIMNLSVFGSVNIFLIVGFLCRVKIRVVWIRTLTTQFKQRKLLVFRKSIIYKLGTNIITNSTATKIDAENFYRVSKNKIKVLPNSVKDLYSIIDISDFDVSKSVVYVGRLHDSKGVDLLINAFSEVHSRFSDFRLIIIGSGNEMSNLKKLTSDLKIEQFVTFTGNLSKVEVLKMFKKSYAAVIPSRSEAFGYTVIEAMSMKTLAIGANNTGIKEIIINNKSGLLFETNNTKDLVNKLTIAISNPELRNELALNGFQHFKENYEVEKATERDSLYFKSLVDRS